MTKFLHAICAACLCMLLVGCAALEKVGIVVKEPTTQMAIQTAAQVAGLKIAKSKPELAQEMLEYTDPERADILTHWPFWKNYITYKLTKDETLRIVVQNMLENVDIQLKPLIPEDQEKIIRGVLRKFREGLQTGLKGELGWNVMDITALRYSTPGAGYADSS